MYKYGSLKECSPLNLLAKRASLARIQQPAPSRRASKLSICGGEYLAKDRRPMSERGRRRLPGRSGWGPLSISRAHRLRVHGGQTDRRTGGRDGLRRGESGAGLRWGGPRRAGGNKSTWFAIGCFHPNPFCSLLASPIGVLAFPPLLHILGDKMNCTYVEESSCAFRIARLL